MKNMLVIQFLIEDGDSFDGFLAIEDTLFQAFSQNRHAVVDGHDYGQGKFNIFIFPRGAWGPVLERVEAFLKLKGWWNRATVAKRLKSERYQVVWPKDFTGEFEL